MAEQSSAPACWWVPGWKQPLWEERAQPGAARGSAPLGLQSPWVDDDRGRNGNDSELSACVL